MKLKKGKLYVYSYYYNPIHFALKIDHQYNVITFYGQRLAHARTRYVLQHTYEFVPEYYNELG